MSMSTHWTYEAIPPEADLAQGDILEPTSALREVLREIHPYFLNPKYVAFLVLSQSCDLVRRSGYQLAIASIGMTALLGPAPDHELRILSTEPENACSASVE